MDRASAASVTPERPVGQDHQRGVDDVLAGGAEVDRAPPRRAGTVARRSSTRGITGLPAVAARSARSAGRTARPGSTRPRPRPPRARRGRRRHRRRASSASTSSMAWSQARSSSRARTSAEANDGPRSVGGACSSGVQPQMAKNTVSRSPCRWMSKRSEPSSERAATSVARLAGSRTRARIGSAALASDLVGEVQPGDQAVEQASGQHGEEQVGGLQVAGPRARAPARASRSTARTTRRLAVATRPNPVKASGSGRSLVSAGCW